MGASLHLRSLVTYPIRLYQRWVSRWLPPSCRFYPSCSQYSVEAIERFGVIRGLGLTLRRLFRCHPFHPGGMDSVPDGNDGGCRVATVHPGSSCTHSATENRRSNSWIRKIVRRPRCS